jgi:hypothetical protein
MKFSHFLFLGCLLLASVTYAGEADVIAVDVKNEGNNKYTFSVTVFHKDEGWDHFADKWDVVTPDGTVLGTRTLLHPHVNEQPFTRSLSFIKIPKNIQKIAIRAHCSIHAYGGKTVTMDWAPSR